MIPAIILSVGMSELRFSRHHLSLWLALPLYIILLPPLHCVLDLILNRLVWFPESPRWLIDHGREEEALEILAEVHGKGDPNAELVQLEFAEIKDQVNFEKKFGAKSYKDLLEPGVLRRVSLGTSLQAWSQLTGVRIFFGFFVL